MPTTTPARPATLFTLISITHGEDCTGCQIRAAAAIGLARATGSGRVHDHDGTHAAVVERVLLPLALDSVHPTVPGSLAPHEDGYHHFEPRPETVLDTWGLDPKGCDYCGQVYGDPIHTVPAGLPTIADTLTWQPYADGPGDAATAAYRAATKENAR